MADVGHCFNVYYLYTFLKMYSLSKDKVVPDLQLYANIPVFISNNNFILAILNNRQQECAARQPPPLDETEPSTSGHPSAAEKDILVRNCL